MIFQTPKVNIDQTHFLNKQYIITPNLKDTQFALFVALKSKNIKL